MKQRRVKILIVCFAIQLIIPLFLVWRHYDTLRNGEQYKVEVSVADPYDPFRGRHVLLQPIYLQKNAEDKTMYAGAYTKLEKGENGYALITQYDGNEAPGLIKNLRIDKYYMSEAQAPEAENIIRKSQGQGNMYVIICVKTGKYVIEGLYYNNQPIEEYLLSQGVY